MADSKYEKNTGHRPDFYSSYRFYSKEEGGRLTPPAQYYRGDFIYAEDKVTDGLFMIYHEFVDDQGDVLLDGTFPVSIAGHARMWILFPESRAKVHCFRIKVGVKYYIMEGAKKVGEGIVEKILDLHKNPKK